MKNKYPGKCAMCGKYVSVGEGRIGRFGGKVVVYHEACYKGIPNDEVTIPSSRKTNRFIVYESTRTALEELDRFLVCFKTVLASKVTMYPIFSSSDNTDMIICDVEIPFSSFRQIVFEQEGIPEHLEHEDDGENNNEDCKKRDPHKELLKMWGLSSVYSNHYGNRIKLTYSVQGFDFIRISTIGIVDFSKLASFKVAAMMDYEDFCFSDERYKEMKKRDREFNFHMEE